MIRDNDFRFMSSHFCRTHCRCLLAAAVQDLFPEVRLLGGETTEPGFYYDFAFPFVFAEHMLIQIEERMRQMKPQFRVLEMVPESAAAFLEHKGLTERALEAKSSQNPLLGLVEWGNFADLVEGGCGPSSGSFKLIEALSHGSSIRIVGLATPSKDELKALVKTWVPIQGRRFDDLGPELELMTFVEGRPIWLPKGEAVRSRLVSLWAEELAKDQIQVVSTHPSSLEEMERLHKKTKLSRTAEMAGIEGQFIDQIFVRGESLERGRASSLLFIEKILTILKLDFKVFSPAKNLTEFHIKDVWGSWRKGPYVRVDKDRKVVVSSVFAPLETFFALLVESCQGAFPLRLAEEQVRVIAIGGADGSEAVAKLLQSGVRAKLKVCDPTDLKKSMHHALRERVPFSIILGNREKESGLVSVRRYGVQETEAMTIETLIGRLKELENQ